MIDADHLTKLFGDRVAIKDASFKVDKGEVVGMLGPNGAGKTTTMRILTCFMPATSGKARVAGYDVAEESLQVRRHIGYMPENVPLYPEMRVREYLHFRARLRGIPRVERREKAARAMEECWIDDVKDRIVGHLSKGYRQRVGLAEAMLHDPEILILDEPTAGLDPNQIRQTRTLMKRLGERRTVILSTHILPEVEMVCSRVVIIHRGKIVPEDEINRLLQKPALVLETKGDDEQAKRILSDIPGVTRVTLLDRGDAQRFEIEHAKDKDVREEVSQRIARQGWPILEFRKAAASLEEVFVKITAGEEA